MVRRLLALGLLAAAAAAVLGARRRSSPGDVSRNGGLRHRSAELRRERERR